MNQSWSWRLVTIMTSFVLTVSSNAVDDIITQTDVQEFDGPIISPSQNEIILNKGQNYTLLCKGNNPLQFKQQELSEEVVGSFYMTQRNVSSTDLEYKYEIALDLYNIDQFAVGYYACFDNTVNSSDVLNKVTEELNNTAHISYIYIYVNGLDNLFAPSREIVIARIGSKVVIECRPTAPDIKVNLTVPQSNKTPEYIKFSSKIGFLVRARRIFKCEGRRGNLSSSKSIRITDTLPPQPKIIDETEYFLKGETFSLNCTVAYQTNSAVMLSWNYPPTVKHPVFNETNAHAVTDGVLFNNITIVNATKEDAGVYTCISKNVNQKPAETSFEKKYLDEPFITLIPGSPIKIETKLKAMRLHSTIDDYPPAKIFFLKNNKEVPLNKTKYSLNRYVTGSVVLSIRDLKIIDTANYTIVASNRYNTTNVTFDLRFIDHPTVDFGPETDKKYLENTEATLRCEAIGYPLPNITWSFSGDKEWTTPGNITILSVYKVASLLSIQVHTSGNITCTASNSQGSTSVNRRFLVYEMPDGFGIKNIDNTWFSENQNVSLKCLASQYDFVNVSWMRDDEELDKFVEFSENLFSFVAKLKIPRISLNQAGNYTCYGNRLNGSKEMQTVYLTVAASRPPIISESNMDKDEEVYSRQPVQFTCQADAVPPPLIEWQKDGKLLANDSNVEIIMNYLDHSIVNSTFEIKQTQDENEGKYECIARSAGREQSKFYNLILKEKSKYKATYLSIIGVIIFVLIILIVYLAWKIRKEKQFRKELAAAGLLNFKEGVTGGLNPELGIDEQAELLPYDEKFEFSPEKLILGKQLGAGAFGVVYKAEARGIINAEETTTVAVKMVKKTADNMYIKALASELKIMVHMGKHINIVNLLGACTKNVGKRELIVIVEYCKFGNIHKYMQKHREVFIDQLTDNKEKTLGKINRGYSSSSGNSGMHSDYFGSNHTQETDHTFLNTANTNRSGRKASETGYVQPEWRSNYESDYSFDGRNPRPLCSRDLLAWAFQIARGMEYLASRKVLHGDLAARNILLAEDNIVKICDFGLARSIYKNDEYQKKENSPLPVKWLAIECMTDRIFSTQSDVWSFGIVLWELFSLAKTPYPNVSPPSLLQWLSEGHRLEKPFYADDKLYGVMRRCWEQKPTARPSFSQLQEMLGSFLEDNVRNHYVDLNSACMDMNVKREGQEDYLAMVCAPDYNNMVTPSPHHYVNDTRSFFPPTPTQLLHDDEGYLQMSPATDQTIFSPRAQGTKFDFDPRKLNPRVSEASSCGSELTPMLTLNNLPARSGSESDHEGGSPYLHMCPRIDEETDEVFHTKQNNARNIHNAAVTNPTYITFDIDVEKKPHSVNDYINVSTPNGLVK